MINVLIFPILPDCKPVFQVPGLICKPYDSQVAIVFWTRELTRRTVQGCCESKRQEPEDGLQHSVSLKKHSVNRNSRSQLPTTRLPIRKALYFPCSLFRAQCRAAPSNRFICAAQSAICFSVRSARQSSRMEC